MTISIINQTPFLRSSRRFPQEGEQLTTELDNSYIDIANAVNNRTISLFPTTKAAVNGESWFIFENKRQQGLRQVYTFGSSLADIPLGFKISSLDRFVRRFGEYTDGTNWYGVIPTTNIAIAGQLGFFIFLDVTSTTTDLIRFTNGGAPAPTKGTLTIEWISDP